jgi:hypothetical protein
VTWTFLDLSTATVITGIPPIASRTDLGSSKHGKTIKLLDLVAVVEHLDSAPYAKEILLTDNTALIIGS